MGQKEYSPQEPGLFIDSSVRSLKYVLLHNGNKYAFIPINNSTSIKEYDYFKLIVEKLVHLEHQQEISVDRKMVNFFMGQQSGYTNIRVFSVCATAEKKVNTG